MELEKFYEDDQVVYQYLLTPEEVRILLEIPVTMVGQFSRFIRKPRL